MGYNTEFYGEFNIKPRLDAAQVNYLDQFAGTRRMKLVPQAAELSDPVREAVGLPPGPDCCYVVATEKIGWEHPLIAGYNEPPGDQPGLWCQWVPNGDGTVLRWDGNEKFYYYVEWLDYLIAHFIKRWRRTLNGEVEWKGEDPDDLGKIVVKNNVISVFLGRVVYDE